VETPSGNNIDDFDVTLTAGLQPPDVPPERLGSVNWSKAAGPDAGSFNASDEMQAKFRNPYEGGLYKLEFGLGIPGAPKSGANVLLPLAGADITDRLESEVAHAATWGAAHKARAMVANASPIIGVAQYRTFRTWMLLSGHAFDYVLVPVSADGTAPCPRFNVPDLANRIYVTVNGVVVHGSKVNNLLWGSSGKAGDGTKPCSRSARGRTNSGKGSGRIRRPRRMPSVWGAGFSTIRPPPSQTS
jgi:hypothetical protein